MCVYIDLCTYTQLNVKNHEKNLLKTILVLFLYIRINLNSFK